MTIIPSASKRHTVNITACILNMEVSSVLQEFHRVQKVRNIQGNKDELTTYYGPFSVVVV